MKRIITSLAALLLLAACGSKKEFSLNVHLSDELVGQMVYLYDMSSQQPIDSALAESADVLFSGLVDEPFVCHLQAGNFYFDFIVEQGAIYVDPINDSLSGTPLNDSYFRTIYRNAAIAAVEQAFMDQYQLYFTLDAAGQSALTPLMDSLYASWTALQKEAYSSLFEENKDNVLGAIALCHLMEEMSSAAELEQMLDEASPAVAQFLPIKKRLEQLRVMEQTAVGQHFVDFPGTDFATGEPTTLAAMIEGKLALVDVWASWCGPCRAEIKENLLRIANEYGPKGLYVLGVDVSDKPENHARAVQELGIKYPQLIDSENRCCDLYGINGIPHILLIAPDGTILARDLRGDAIEAAIRQALQ